MPLHMTKIAFGCDDLSQLQRRLNARQEEGATRLTTRYLPKRHGEMVGGSLYWIIAHQLQARSQILGFEDAPDGRTHIVIEPQARPVSPKPKRAHQGWRYLKAEDTPRDLAEGEVDVRAQMPPGMLKELSRLGLV